MASDQEKLLGRLNYRVNNPSAWPEGFDQAASDMIREAADEIERLQAASAIPPSGKAVAWMHRLGAIWRADNCPSDIDFLQDGWTPLYAADEAMVERIWQAVLSCPHSITGEEVVLRRSYTEPGKNAADQLHKRICAALNPQPNGGA